MGYRCKWTNITPPDIMSEGDDLVATLATGEKVVFDKNSKTIKSGPLYEKPSKLNTPPEISYNGTGISIVASGLADARKATRALVRQGDRECHIPSSIIWNKEGLMKYSRDQDLVSALNEACEMNFSLTK